MEATVSNNSPWRMVTACAGVEFVKGTWKTVPAGREQEARNNALLETREPEAEELPLEIVEPVPTPSKRKRTK